MKLTFTKMHGCGNDFIIVDHRKPFLLEENLQTIIQTLCTRKLHIGANGFMLLEKSEYADFSMRYFNRDGSKGEMCGNGARCIVKYAHMVGASTKNTIFETNDTTYHGKIDELGFVTIAFPSVSTHTIHTYTVEQHTIYFLWVGVPHVVIFSEKLYALDNHTFAQFGQKIRNMTHLFPEGTNVNIVQREQTSLHIRTYERGVEEETLACGSGATASAIIAHLFADLPESIKVHTKGGDLTIQFKRKATNITDITLTGEAVMVYEGTTTI